MGRCWENSSPRSSAARVEVAQSARSAPLPSASAIRTMAGVARHAKRAGSMRLVVNSWRSRSAVSMTPPGLERRSMIRPLRGIWRRRSATSLTKPVGVFDVEGPQSEVAERAVRGRDLRAETASEKLVCDPVGGFGGRAIVGLVALPERGGEQQLAGSAGGLAGDVDRAAGAQSRSGCWR